MEDYKKNVLHEEDESSKADFRRQETLEKKLGRQEFNAQKKKAVLEEVNELVKKFAKKEPFVIVPQPKAKKTSRPEQLVSRKEFKKIDEDINLNHIYWVQRARMRELEERKRNQPSTEVKIKKKEVKEYKKSSGKKEKMNSWKEYLQKDCFAIPKKVQEGYVIKNRPGVKNEDLKHSISYRAFAIIS